MTFRFFRHGILALLMPLAIGGATLAFAVLPGLRGSAAESFRKACPKSAHGRLVAASSSQLKAVLRCAPAGTTVVLKPGNYGEVKLSGLHGITLQSEDPAAPASFERLNIEDSDRVSVSQLRFAGPAGSVPYRFDIWNSRDVRGLDLDFRGTVGRLNDATTSSVYLRSSDRVELRRLAISGPPDAILFLDVNDLVIADSYIHDFQSDAIQGTRSSRLLISGNYITNAHPAPGDHPDGIQLFTSQSRQSASDIVVKDNLIDKGKGGLMQGIHIIDEVGNRPFRNVRIEGNLVVGSMYNGIGLGGAIGGRVSDNTVVPSAEQRNWIRIERVNPVVISGNVAQDYLIDGTVVKSGPLLRANRGTIVPETETRALVESWKMKHLTGERAQ